MQIKLSIYLSKYNLKIKNVNKIKDVIDPNFCA